MDLLDMKFCDIFEDVKKIPLGKNLRIINKINFISRN